MAKNNLIRYTERPCAGGCGELIRHLWPTCGAPACKKNHLRNYNRAYKDTRYEQRVRLGLCTTCGLKIPKNAKNKTTGTPLIAQCPRCRKKDNARVRKRRASKAAQKRKELAALRIAENAIKRERANLIRAEVGLPPSRRTTIPRNIDEIVEL